MYVNVTSDSGTTGNLMQYSSIRQKLCCRLEYNPQFIGVCPSCLSISHILERNLFSFLSEQSSPTRRVIMTVIRFKMYIFIFLTIPSLNSFWFNPTYLLIEEKNPFSLLLVLIIMIFLSNNVQLEWLEFGKL